MMVKTVYFNVILLVLAGIVQAMPLAAAQKAEANGEIFTKKKRGGWVGYEALKCIIKEEGALSQKSELLRKVSMQYDINSKNTDGENIFHYIAGKWKSSYKKVLPILVQLGGEINNKDTFGNPPVFFVSTQKALLCFQKNGADLGAKNKTGTNYFMIAGCVGNVGLLKSLRGKYYLNAMNDQGDTALSLLYDAWLQTWEQYEIARGNYNDKKSKLAFSLCCLYLSGKSYELDQCANEVLKHKNKVNALGRILQSYKSRILFLDKEGAYPKCSFLLKDIYKKDSDIFV